MIKLHAVQNDELKSLWHIARPFIEKSLPYADDKYSIDDVFSSLIKNDSQLFIVIENEPIAAFTTCIVNYPQSKRLIIEFCGGERVSDWIHTIDYIRDWAREMKCDAIEVYGRPGWEKHMPLKKISSVMREFL